MTATEFKSWRERLNLTRDSAAAELGRTKRTIEAYEAGETTIPKVVELATMELERRANA